MNLLNSILSALASLHAQGLFHGHVTPGRILFSSPSRNELGAATAKLCYLEKAHGAGNGWQAGGTTSPMETADKDLRYLHLHIYTFTRANVGCVEHASITSSTGSGV